jgi:hypothetical protein
VWTTLVTFTNRNIEFSAEEKCKQIERKVNDLLEESIYAFEKRDLKLASVMCTQLLGCSGKYPFMDTL